MAAWTVAPNLPADNATGVSVNPTFTWTKTDNGDPEPRIQLTIADNIGLTDPIVDIYFPTAETFSLTAFDLDNNTDYYWGVAVEATIYPSIRKFTTVALPPTLISPVIAATDVAIAPLVQWENNDGSTQFDLQFSESATFAGAEGVDQWTYDDIVAEEYTPGTSLPVSTKIYWRVRVTDGVTDGPWTDGGEYFTTTAGVPSIPVLNYPIAGATDVSLNELFQWTNSGGDSTSFELWFDTVIGFTDPTKYTTTDVLYRAPSGLLVNSGVYFWKVVGINTAGETSSAIRTFTVIAPSVPAKPISLLPTGTVSSMVPILTWSPATDAETYHVQVSTSSTFATILEEDIAVVGTSYQVVTELSLSTTYYWRVKGLAPLVGGSWGDTATFDTAATAQPGVPVWVSPLNGAVDVSLTPTLDWTDTASTDTWELDVVDSSGNTVIGEAILFASGSEYIVPSGIFLPGETYTASVRSFNAAGNTYSKFAVTTFTTIDSFATSAPIITVPVNGSTVAEQFTATWTFSLSSVEIRYDLEIAIDSVFNNVVIYKSQLIPLEVAIDFSLYPDIIGINHLYIRVRATKNGKGNQQASAWSTVHHFYRDTSVAPSTPTIVFPEDVSTDVQLPVFCFWTAGTNTDSYNLQISTDGFVTTVINEVGLTSIQYYAEGLLYNTAYSIRVRGYSNSYSGGWGAWSTVFTFTTEDTEKPGALSLITPLNFETGVSLTPYFNWTEALYATYYTLQISTDSAFTQGAIVYISGSVAVNYLTLPAQDTLDSQTLYFWRVRGVNSNGNGAWSKYFQFTTADLVAPQKPILVLPDDYSGDNVLEPYFTWREGYPTTAIKYLFQVDDNNDFSSLNYEGEDITDLFLDLSISNAKVTVTNPLEYDKRYYWRVRGINIDDTAGEWSDFFTFTLIDTPAPLKPLVSIPTYNQEVTKTFTITFEGALFATSHIVQVCADGSFRNPVVNTEVTGTTLEVTLHNGKTYYLRIQGIGRGGYGEYSEDLIFTVET